MSGHIPRKRFGQHFLHERHYIEKIISAIHPSQDDILVEIGPGQGAITDHLIGRSQELHIIELDKDLIDILSQRYINEDNITIHNCDVLKFPFDEHFSAPIKLVGNLPYNISTPIMFHLFQYLNNIKEMTFMFQKEVVDRLVAKPRSKDYSRLSVMTQLYCETSHLFDVPAGAFSPPPKVTSAVARLEPYSQSPDLNQVVFSQVVKNAFSQRRKMVKKNLQNLISIEEFIRIGIPENARAQDLSVDDFKKISQIIGGNKEIS